MALSDILHSTIASLRKSQDTDWNESDDLDDWIELAHRMHRTINALAPIMGQIAESIKDLEKTIIARDVLIDTLLKRILSESQPTHIDLTKGTNSNV